MTRLILLDLVDQALSRDIPKGVVVCDCAYGNGNPFRQALVDRQLFYAAEIEAKTIVFDEPRKTRRRAGEPAPGHETGKVSVLTVKDFALKLHAPMWKTIKWREGTKRRLVSRFAAVRVLPAHRPANVKWRPPGSACLSNGPKGSRSPRNIGSPIWPHRRGLAGLSFLPR